MDLSHGSIDAPRAAHPPPFENEQILSLLQIGAFVRHLVDPDENFRNFENYETSHPKKN